MDETGRLTDVEFWQNFQGKAMERLPEGGSKPPWLKHVKRYLPKDPGASCIEVGFVPGEMLLYFASHFRYQVSGIDFSPQVHDLNQAFTAQGIAAELIEADFLAWNSVKNFDLVYSHGFIEHFENYPFVIKKQWELVKPGGLLLMTIPVLTPVQYFIRQIFYTKEKWEEITNSHNQTVTPGSLKETANGLPGGCVLLAKYTSEMRVWFGVNTRGIKKNLKPLLIAFKCLDRIIRYVGISSHWYSPTFLVLIKKE
jgi:SAM-dependent methyltransferase